MEDRDGIFDYIEEDSTRAAVDVDDRTRSQVRQRLQLPEPGRRGRIEGTRELVIGSTPYIAAYRIAGDTV
ncbi:type II toxin-antitoxin system RelE/ParE family toxin [Paraburkholderia sp. Ac-20336]|nr:type II toxin-antitoxin system RelE/ParE family toxin [Paraburkholderia sp. Ac-20336]